MDQDETSCVLRFHTVNWSLESRSIKQMDNKIEGRMERTPSCRKIEFVSRRSAIHLERIKWNQET